MSSLVSMFPQPVTINLGGEDYVVGQLRIRDLAKIQEFLELWVPHPFAGRDDVLLLGDEQREIELLKIARADAQWPVVFGSEQADQILASVGGMAFLLLISLGRYQQITQEKCLEIARGMTISEIIGFRSIIYNISDQDRLFNLLSPSKRRPTNPLIGTLDLWGEKIDEVARAYGWSYDQIGDMTISQFNLARSAGVVNRPRPPREEGLTHEEIVQRVAEKRKLLGLD